MARLFATFAVLVTATLLLSQPAAAEGVFVVGNTHAGGYAALLNGNHPTSAEAQADGLAQCRRDGLVNCRVAATYRKACYAYAFAMVPGGGLGGAAAATEQEARRNAIATCQRYNPGFNCYAHDSACDTIDEQEVRSAQEAEARAQAEEAARERAEREERRRQRQAELQREREEQQRREDNEERQRIADADSKRRASETQFCLAGDIYACNRLLNNPRLIGAEREVIETKRRELFFVETEPVKVPPPSERPTIQAVTPLPPPSAKLSPPDVKKTEHPGSQRSEDITAQASWSRSNVLWTLLPIPVLTLLTLALLGITALPYEPNAPLYSTRFKREVRHGFAIDALNDAWKALLALPSALLRRFFPIDTPRALNAMEITYSYIRELEAEELSEPRGELNTVSLATRLIRKAEWYDPDAVLMVVEDETEIVLTLSALKARALHAEAKVRLTNNQPNRAAACLRQAVALIPNDGHLHFLLGIILTELAQKRQAISALKRAVQLDPADVEYRKALDRARHISRSAKAIRDAGSTGRGLAALIRYGLFGLLAWLLYKYIISPGWMAGQTRSPNAGIGEMLAALIVYGTLCFMIIVLPYLLIRTFLGWIMATPIDAYYDVKNRFRR